MRSTIITRQTIHQGTEELAIVRSPLAYYVIHIDPAQHCTPLPQARYTAYTEAHERLQQEFHRSLAGQEVEKKEGACPSK